MKLKLIIDKEEPVGRYGSTKPLTVNLLPADDVLDFIYAVASSFESKAFGLYEEIEQSIKDGDIDSVALLAPEAKKANDTYLDIYRAAELLDRDLRKAREGVE